MDRFGIKDFDSLREGNQIETKSAIKGCPDLWDTYSSFANTFGGKILLGVKEEDDKSFSLSHTEDPDKVLRDFNNILNNKNKVSVNILSSGDIDVRKEGKDTIIVINVPQADRHFKPVYINGNIMSGTFKRSHEGDYHCPEYEIKAMIADSLDESSTLPFADFSSLNKETLSSYRQMFSSHSPSHPFNKLNDDDFLLHLGAASKDKDGVIKLTKSGLLMFGNEYEINNYFPKYFLDYSHFSSERMAERYDDRLESSSGDWSGNMFDFLLSSLTKIGQKMPRGFSWISHSEVRNDDIPLKRAIREAIVNALSNADFVYSEGLVIKHYPSRIVFENPGLLMMSQNKVLEGGHSDPRNPAILKMLNLLGMGERSGSGIPLIEDVLLTSGLPALTLTQSVEPDRTTLSIPLINNEKEGKIVIDSLREKLFSINLETSDSESLLAFFIKTGSTSFTRNDLASNLSISSQRASLLIRKLVDSNIVALAPFTKRGKYIVLK